MTAPCFPSPEADASAELLTREADFLARRRRVVRAFSGAGVTFVVGLGALAAARGLAPEAFDAALPVVVLCLVSSIAHLGWTWARHWRCPACRARWKLADGLASSHWNHCPACGGALRAYPQRTPGEKDALGESETLPIQELVERFRRRRRWGIVGGVVTVVLGVAAFGWAEGHGWSETAKQVVVAAFAGLATALAVVSARCPRCRLGILAGRTSHCQRCGLTLQPGAEPGGDPPAPPGDPGPDGSAP